MNGPDTPTDGAAGSNDDPTIARLRAGLDSLTSTVTTTPPSLGTATATVIELHPHRRRAGLVAAAAALVALAVAGVVWVTGGDDSAQLAGTDDTTAPTDEPTMPPTQPDAARPILPLPVTPDGWVVIEWGDVRLSVPQEMSPFDAVTGCIADVLATGDLAISCGNDSVRVGHLRDATRAADGAMNGLPTFLDVPDCDGCPVALGIPELAVEVVARVASDTAVAEQIIGTVGVSGRWRADNEPPRPVPDGWQQVDYEGVSLWVPGDWSIDTLDAHETGPDPCNTGLGDGTVVLGNGSRATIRCIAPPTLTAPLDGVWVYAIPIADAVNPPVPGLPVVDRAVDGEGPHVVRVGMGVDPEIGLAILGSIGGVEPELPEPGVTTVPPTGPPTTPPTSPPTSPPADPSTYRGIFTVLESPEHGPQLCSSVLDSLPPQCSGPDIANWNWDAVPAGSSDSANGTTWGEFVVTGTWDAASSTFTLGEAPRSPIDADRAELTPDITPDFSVPCAEPDGGWQLIDPSKPDWDGEQAQALDGYAGAWIDSTQRIFTVRIVGDLAAAEAAIREFYGGPLCVVAADKSLSELLEIQAALGDSGRAQTWSSVSEVTGVVEVGTFAPDAQWQAELDATYGEGTVVLYPELHPVD